AAFAEANVGTWTVIADVSIDNTNYSLTSRTASDEAEIFAKELTATIDAEDKTYDGNTDAEATGSVPAEDVISGDVVNVSVENAAFAEANVGTWTVIADVSIDNTNYSLTSVTAETTANITPAPTTITVQDAIANCDGNKVTLTATVKTKNTAIQGEADTEGGKVIFRVGDKEIGFIDSSTNGVFSGDISIDLPRGSSYEIISEFIPGSGNLSGSETDSKLTVFEVTIKSSEKPNENGNVVIFDGAANSLGLPSSTTLTADFKPSLDAEVNYQWYFKNADEDVFTILTGETKSTYTVIASEDFTREYKVEINIDGNCVANNIFSKVVSVEASCGKAGQNKVQVCHVTPNGKRKTICVSANAVEALINGNPGSYIGNCNILYRADQEPELITVAWNTPVEIIKGEIATQSMKWFNRKQIKMNISTESYNSLQPGIYALTAELEVNEFYELNEPIAISVLVLEKPLALDIAINNNQLANDLRSGQLIGTLNTIDPIDNIHVYNLVENELVELNGDQLIWKGSQVPAKFTIQVTSTDRAGQTISREIQLTREIRPNRFILFPNPAQNQTNLMVDLDEGVQIEIRVFDAVGRVVIQDSIYREETFIQTLNLDGLATGMYLVQVKTGDIIMTERLIKR
ncbi:MAG: T9SS C-terminal target domain-containing protein, partial [Mongoliibacter sp.]|uniref:T9SS type A sorting domain-containing protein n=1 Tax=Mongoliibacter sp. TaxID=2022438 RepID=UPI0012F03329